MDMKTKAIALENIDKMVEMDVSTGEHSKMDLWINGLMRIPFGKYNHIPINPESGVSEKREFITNTYKTLDKAIYGHKEAKTHILQVIGKWMKNPDSSGNVLAIQGPMGNGKTTLVKDGISKVLNRPFHFIALGGASDSAYFDGHCYTYEGSHWGRIVQILQDSKCMNPVIYFDELDKISDTNKGEEIIHMLTHLTDPSQNNLFQDNYFPGVNLDLSKALFIFSYNDESKVNRILKDRMYVIHTKGFKTDDKIKICNEYLIPEIFNTFAFEKDDLVFTTDIIKKIVEKFTGGEEGVRNLKRCIETIVSKINIHILSDGDSGLSFKLKELVLPVTLTEEHIEILLKVDNGSDKPPYGMYS
jgi:ATP-dependent Lon protease